MACKESEIIYSINIYVYSQNMGKINDMAWRWYTLYKWECMHKPKRTKVHNTSVSIHTYIIIQTHILYISPDICVYVHNTYALCILSWTINTFAVNFEWHFSVLLKCAWRYLPQHTPISQLPPGFIEKKKINNTIPFFSHVCMKRR